MKLHQILLLLALAGTAYQMTTEEFNLKYFWGTFKPQLVHSITSRNTVTNNPLTIGMVYYTDDKEVVNEDDLCYLVPQRQHDDIIYNYKFHNGHSYALHEVTNPYVGNFDTSYFKLSSEQNDQQWIDIFQSPKQDFPAKRKQTSNFKVEQQRILEENGDDYYTVIYFVALEEWDSAHPDTRVVGFEQRQNGDILASVYSDSDVNSASVEYITFYDQQNQKLGNYFKEYAMFDRNRNVNWNMQKPIFEWVQNNTKSDQTYGTSMAMKFRIPYNQDVEIVVRYDQNKPSYERYNLATATQIAQSNFISKYSQTFGNPHDDVSEDLFDCGMQSFSNLMGGIQYSFGFLVCAQVTAPNCLAKLPMFTHTPSRYEFPRPYLWDDGFHMTLSCQWDPYFCLNDIENWFGTQGTQGWVPREQARGMEIQHYTPITSIENEHEGNPTTLAWELNYLKKLNIPDITERVKKLLPNVENWFSWWQDTQKVEGYNLYKWWGPNERENWGSGMDDWPRYDGDYYSVINIDCSAWMYDFTNRISQLFEGIDSQKVAQYQRIAQEIKSDIYQHLYDSKEGTFRDLLYNNNTNKYELSPHDGYPNFIPLGVSMIYEKDSALLNKQLKDLMDPKTLWSDYGILSLSRQDPLFGVGAKYWKGPIWINIQYMLLRSTKEHYFQNEDMVNFYTQLRSNVAHNVCKNKEKYGYFFETFNEPPDTTGRGSNSHPFNGWTSTVTLMITESYL